MLCEQLRVILLVKHIWRRLDAALIYFEFSIFILGFSLMRGEAHLFCAWHSTLWDHNDALTISKPV